MTLTDIDGAPTEGSEMNPSRRARVAVLGEFSAGKSTLINLITGGRILRTQVTATQMPAVWMSYGADNPYRVDLDGNEILIDLNELSTIPVADTAYIRVFRQTPVLELCDLIDTPGNSDPNIAPIAWERIAAIADVAIWCSSATQAWRQSEAAAWSEIPDRLRDNSVLLLTRADKLGTQNDREKVLRRVTSEAGDLFRSIHMGSLLSFDAVRPAMRDVVELCRSINETQTPSPSETAQILRDMAGGAETSKRSKTDETMADDAFRQTEQENTVHTSPAGSQAEMGPATALWYQMTDNLPMDDPEALDNAFNHFLTRIDREIQALRDIANIGKVG